VACLVDTNVLVRLAVPADPHHLSASRCLYGEQGLMQLRSSQAQQDGLQQSS
jgi:hypothetical protein